MAKIQSDSHAAQPDQAKQRYIEATEMADKLKMRPLLAHCSLEFAQFYMRNGEFEKARFELQKAIDLYRSLNMTFWQPKAVAILSELS